jgi:CDP-diacylglycerol--glycerol-3-phosphate 3-phosphatidyltransferase
VEHRVDNYSVVSGERWVVTKLSEGRKTLAVYFTQSVVSLLAKTHIKPNTVTWLGFIVTAGATALIVTRHLLAAGFVVLIAGFFDILDGALARRTNQTSRFGAVLDSTLDRLGEAAVLLGLLSLFLLTEENSALFSLIGKEWAVMLVGVTLLGSFLVSYIRARAEALDLECQVGIFTRAERVVVLALGLLLSHFDYSLTIALLIIVVFSFVTVGQRLFYVWRHTRN